MSVTGFRYGKSLEDYLVRATLPKLNVEDVKHVGKRLVWSVVL